MSNAEIEDVLTSIRRLVSGEAEASKASQNNAENGAAHKPVAKLILTSDFRIPDDDELATDSESETPEVAFHHSDDGAPMNGEGAETAVSGDHTDPQPEADESDQHKAEDGQKPQAEDPADQIEDAIILSDDSGPLQESGDHSLKTKIAELESAIGAQQGGWEPDGSAFQEDPEAEEPLTHVLTSPLTEPVQDAIEGHAHDLAADAPEASQSESDLAEATAEQPATDEHSATAEQPVDEHHSAGTSAEESPVEAPSVDESFAAAAAAAAAQSNPDGDVFDLEEDIIDEEALRDMVSEIVRQELQGALGERITRNVRKLVRREINRMMTARDFD
ncbi:MAG: hypothetical protein CSA68_03635 [Rhodobacterales bacterium]|nr:MAG: hypothetical protein CSA68_03635 [Rhodobacterales bacterium]